MTDSATAPTPDSLNAHYAIPNALRFEYGDGGLVRALLTTQLAEAAVYLHGAHVASYRRETEPPLLFMSERSWFEAGRPIRGGVPVCFPWFAARAGDAQAPAHGFARLLPWRVEAAEREPGCVTLTLVLTASEETRRFWPHDFELRHRVRVGAALGMGLEVRNTGREAFTFEAALHTYLAVSDARRVRVTGLEGAAFLDKVDRGRRKTQGGPVVIEGETDRVYAGHRGACVVEDPGLNRRVTLEKRGSATTVVWNPWVEKAARMPDFGDDEWPRMLCVETGNAVDDAVTLRPGESHEMAVEIHSAR